MKQTMVLINNKLFFRHRPKASKGKAEPMLNCNNVAKTRHTACRSQSECFMSANHSYATKKFVYGIGSWF